MSMALTEIGEAAVRGERLPALLRLAVSWIGEALAADAARAYQSAQGEIRLVASHGDHRPSSPIAGFGSFEAFALGSGASVAYGGGAEERFDAGPLAAAGLASGIAVPVRGRDEPLALITVHWASGGEPAVTDLRFAEAVARILSAAAQRHLSERELRARERRSRALLEAADVALFTIDDQGVVAWATGQAAALLGTGRLGLAGVRLSTLFSDLSSDPGGAAFLEELRQRGRLQGSAVAQGTRASPLHYEAVAEVDPGLHAVYLREPSPAPRPAPAAAVRGELLGELAGSLSHELNNPLACVKANLHYAAERLRAGGDEDGAAAADDAVAGVNRLEGLVRALRPLTRPGKAPAISVAPRELVESCLVLASGALRSRARVACDLRDVPPVKVAGPELAQALLSLLFRAARAAGDAGARGAEVKVGLHPAAQGTVELSVVDCAASLSARAAPSEVDLAAARQVAEASGGRVSVESGPGGSTVRLFLPAAAGSRT